MKAADLIKALQVADPNTEVGFSLGDKHEDEYRDMCAKAELETMECLSILDVAVVEIISDEMPWANVVLRQSNILDCDLYTHASDFDKKYPDLKFYPENK